MMEGLARCGWREEEEDEDEEEEGGGRASVERERDSPVGRGHARSAPTRRRWIHRVASRKEALNYFATLVLLLKAMLAAKTQKQSFPAKEHTASRLGRISRKFAPESINVSSCLVSRQGLGD